MENARDNKHAQAWWQIVARLTALMFPASASLMTMPVVPESMMVVLAWSLTACPLTLAPAKAKIQYLQVQCQIDTGVTQSFVTVVLCTELHRAGGSVMMYQRLHCIALHCMAEEGVHQPAEKLFRTTTR